MATEGPEIKPALWVWVRMGSHEEKTRRAVVLKELDDGFLLISCTTSTYQDETCVEVMRAERQNNALTEDCRFYGKDIVRVARTRILGHIQHPQHRHHCYCTPKLFQRIREELCEEIAEAERREELDFGPLP